MADSAYLNIRKYQLDSPGIEIPYTWTIIFDKSNSRGFMLLMFGPPWKSLIQGG